MTRTPMRVSLFGGGTDYPAYFQDNPGAVVGLTIDKYIYLSALVLGGGQRHEYRVAYSQLEQTDDIGDIKHPVVREVLRHFHIDFPLDINVLSDVPASGGLGSSSAFTVGFVNLIQTILGQSPSKIDLAHTAIFVEQTLLQESVGVQDQLHTAIGGINRFDFIGSRFSVSPVHVPQATLGELNQSLYLIDTGVSRRATDYAGAQLQAIRSGGAQSDLSSLYAMVGECVDLLESSGRGVMAELGRRLDESWKIKRRLTASITTSGIDDLYRRAKAAGAYGGKLCGAGGGGFLLVVADPERYEDLVAAVSPLAVIPVRLDVHGSSVIYPSQGAVRMPTVAPGAGVRISPTKLQLAAAGE